MKFHRVKATLPAEVTVRTATTRTTGSLFDDLFSFTNPPPFGGQVRRTEQKTTAATANVPTEFELEVPESAAAETARALRAMAAELESEK